ncbi:hypothetical protein JCM8547_001877 [Rhodosporidiobolus lusitaniae]
MSAPKTGLRLGYIAPNFDAQTTQGNINFHEFKKDSWAILFSHPADFTPVCTTELAEAARLAPKFEERGVKLLGLSCNELKSHGEWVQDINKFGNVDVQFPIIADPSREVAELYDMTDALDETNKDAAGIPFTVRSVFVVDPKNIIRLSLTYPASTGRHFDEILRVVDSLQLGDKNKITTPANWQPGDRVIVHPSVSTEDAKKIFPGEVEESPTGCGGYGDNNGNNYGVRIGVGVGIAVAVAIAILLVGYFMRRRRARAFKTAYPLQQVNYAEQGQAQQGQFQGYGGAGYGQQQQPQDGQQWAPPQGDAPPQYSNYTSDTTSHYAPPAGAPPTSSTPIHYAPPMSPPPAATASTAHYAPPSGPPPGHPAAADGSANK